MSVLFPLTPDQISANQVLGILQQQYQQLVQNGTRGYNLIWKNPQATPQQVITALGTSSAQVFQLAELNIQILASAAAITGIAAPVIPAVPTGWTLAFNQDGSATVTPPPPAS